MKTALGRFTDWSTGKRYWLKDNDTGETYSFRSLRDIERMRDHIITKWDKGNNEPFVRLDTIPL